MRATTVLKLKEKHCARLTNLVEFVKSCNISEPDLCGNDTCLGGPTFQQQRFNIRERGLMG